MYLSTFWKDQANVPSNTYRVTDNGDGTVTAERAGREIQKGTNMSAANFNNMELGIADSSVAAAIYTFYELQYQRLEEEDPDVMDCLLAGRLVTFGNYQQQMMTDDALDALRTELDRRASSIEDTVENNAEAANLSETDNRVAGALTAFGSKQRQMMNEAEFALIASEALGESHEVTLTNNQKFPFNSTVDSPVSVALTKRRTNLFYSVEPEVTAHTGPVGDIAITGKALNGFKVSFNGSGSSVTMILRVKGGMSHG